MIKSEDIIGKLEEKLKNFSLNPKVENIGIV